MEKKFKVIIAGGRNFADYNLLKKRCDFYLQKINYPIEIVCGMARGADLLGKKYGDDNKYNVVEFPANWNKYGKSAGYIRNSEMANYADALIAFWDGKSNGTNHMINIAKEKKLFVKIVYY